MGGGHGVKGVEECCRLTEMISIFNKSCKLRMRYNFDTQFTIFFTFCKLFGVKLGEGGYFM